MDRMLDSLRGSAQIPVWLEIAAPLHASTFWGPPLLQASFDGSLDRIALFLSQVISYFDMYGRYYPSQWSMVVAVTSVLTGEVADWVSNLHSDHARELTNIGMFLESLRDTFEDETRVITAEG